MNGAITQRESATAVTPEFFLCVVVDFFVFWPAWGAKLSQFFSETFGFFSKSFGKSFFSL